MRALAYKSLSVNHSTFSVIGNASAEVSLTELRSNPSISNNLFVYWLIYTRSQNQDYALTALSKDLQKLTMKAHFLEFIQSYCDRQLEQKRLRENKYFDEALFQDTITLIQQYYAIDPSLTMVVSKSTPPKM